MNTDETIEQLIEAGILDHTDTDSLVLTDQYVNQVGSVSPDTEGPISPGETRDTGGTELLGHYEILHHYDIPDLDERRLTLAVFLSQFHNLPPTDGVPEPFLAIRGDLLNSVLELVDKSVIYVWLNNCPPCDVMKEELAEIFSGDWGEITPLAVYGPDWQDLLESEFDVVGGPTTLFVLNGGVDARLVGAHYESVIEKELRMLRDEA